MMLVSKIIQLSGAQFYHAHFDAKLYFFTFDLKKYLTFNNVSECQIYLNVKHVTVLF